MTTHIRVDGLYKVFGARPRRALELAREGRDRAQLQDETGHVLAVDDVSFEVQRGELFVVMGLSGSGKSTVVRMLNRLIEPTAGTVEIDGQDVNQLDAAGLRRLRQEKISMVFQHFALFPHRTVGENAAYGLKVQGVGETERRERAERALETVGLSGWADHYPHELSGGMQQRVGLARGLATEADILLMDEPFSALDPLIRRDMQDLLAQLQAELERTIVFITHDLNEAMRLGDRICVLKDGRVVQIGTGPEIIGEPANDYVADFVADVDRSRVLTADLAMRAPRRTFAPTDHPRTVLEWLDEQEFNGAYVLDEDACIIGVARDDRLAKGIRDGAEDIRDLLTQDYARSMPDTLLSDLATLAAQHTVPIAVTDDEGHLVGVVPRARLLATLSGEETPAHA
ncbi:glycine betaine/L-proline ABC transporter ATP-binding protein [Euzebya sp.]|uniref:quaternary amine ABC transporter ATP-binding protein n=1 Tax=Euzebya sp. TaxID=1971409 RepID=UPI003519CB4C